MKMQSELDLDADEITIKVTIGGRNAFVVSAYELDMLVRRSKHGEENYIGLVRDVQAGIKELYGRTLTIKQTESLFQKKVELEESLKKNGSIESTPQDTGDELTSSLDDLRTGEWVQHPNIS